MYNAGKTIEKTVTPPLFILALSAALHAILTRFDVETDKETTLEIMIIVFGTFQGLINFIKHRKK